MLAVGVKLSVTGLVPLVLGVVPTSEAVVAGVLSSTSPAGTLLPDGATFSVTGPALSGTSTTKLPLLSVVTVSDPLRPGAVTVTVCPDRGCNGVPLPLVSPRSWFTVPEIASSPAVAVAVYVAGTSEVFSSTSLTPVNSAGFSAVSVTLATEAASVIPPLTLLAGSVTV